jgi:hypothetical protein
MIRMNLYLTDKLKKTNICPQRKPPKGSFWLGWQDLNLRMTESKSVALPLGYSPMKSTAFARAQQ